MTDLHDLTNRRDTHGTDEQGRPRVNAHGDVDVLRTDQSNYPVQLPLEPGAVVEIDGQTDTFVGLLKDGIGWADGSIEGVHHFNTRVRNATEIHIEHPED